MPELRHLVLACAFVATTVASLWDVGKPDAALPEVRRDRAGSARVASLPRSTTSTPAVESLLRRRIEHYSIDLFATRSWLPPPGPPSKVEAPRAPPLPFRYLGMLMDGPDIQVFLAQDARTHLLRKGDVQAGYKVEEITTTGMTFVYLALNEKQRLMFGSAN
jgi:hypothetical protein